jgi:hypothetical protein
MKCVSIIVENRETRKRKEPQNQDKNCERYGEILIPSAARAALKATAGVFQPGEKYGSKWKKPPRGEKPLEKAAETAYTIWALFTIS